MLEYWGKEQEINHLNCNNSFKPIIPLLHHPIIPIGAKPLSSIMLFDKQSLPQIRRDNDVMRAHIMLQNWNQSKI
jgi:hypothetical protein